MFVGDDVRLCREEHSVTGAICEVLNRSASVDSPHHSGPHVGRVESAWVVWSDETFDYEGTVTLPPATELRACRHCGRDDCREPGHLEVS